MRHLLLKLILADRDLALVEGAVVILLLPGPDWSDVIMKASDWSDVTMKASDWSIPGVQSAQGAVVAHTRSSKAVVIVLSLQLNLDQFTSFE